jgi:hypothetical protein
MQILNVFWECIFPLLLIFLIIVVVAIWPSEKMPGGTDYLFFYC